MFRLLLIILIFQVSIASASTDFNMKLLSPFHTVKDLHSYKELSKRFQDGFGAFRNRGHLHSALDIKGDYSEPVYPVKDGLVVAVWGEFPYTTVAILHKDDNGKIFFTSSVHMGEVYVKPGDYVYTDTKIARLLNKEEQKRAYYSKVHMHLEFRKSLENFKASGGCYTMEQLREHFYDPKPILKKHMN